VKHGIINENLKTRSITGLAVQENTIFVSSAADSAIWRSNDGGETWENTHRRKDISRFMPVPHIFGAFGGVLFLHIEHVLWRSIDYGENWNAVGPPSGVPEYYIPDEFFYLGDTLVMTGGTGFQMSGTKAMVLRSVDKGVDNRQH